MTDTVPGWAPAYSERGPRCRTCHEEPDVRMGALCWRCDELKRLTVSRRRGRRAFIALLGTWLSLVALSFTASPPTPSCDAAAPHPDIPIRPGVSGAPSSANA